MLSLSSAPYSRDFRQTGLPGPQPFTALTPVPKANSRGQPKLESQRQPLGRLDRGPILIRELGLARA